MQSKEEKEVYELYTQDGKNIKYYVSFSSEPPDFRYLAKLLTMRLKDRGLI